MARQGDTAVFDLAYAQYENSVNMSERLGALKVLVWNDAPQAKAALRTSIIALKMKHCH
jgi:aminopeptidase N